MHNFLESPDPQDKPEISDSKIKDKNNALMLARGASTMGFFFSIVEATNLFLINSFQNNYLALGFGLITIFLTGLYIATLVWSVIESKNIRGLS